MESNVTNRLPPNALGLPQNAPTPAGIPFEKRRLREEILFLSQDLESLQKKAAEWRDKFSRTIILIYKQKFSRTLKPDPNAMQEGFEALVLLTSEDYARHAFAEIERMADAKVCSSCCCPRSIPASPN